MLVCDRTELTPKWCILCNSHQLASYESLQQFTHGVLTYQQFHDIKVSHETYIYETVSGHCQPCTVCTYLHVQHTGQAVHRVGLMILTLTPTPALPLALLHLAHCNSQMIDFNLWLPSHTHLTEGCLVCSSNTQAL